MRTSSHTRNRSTLVRSCLVGALALSLTGQAAAAKATAPTLRASSDELRWTGTFERAHPADPAMCALDACDDFDFEVRLPPDVWRRPGGVQVAIAWQDTDFDLDLRVYGPDGAEVSAARSLHFATGHAVRVPAARNGAYRVVVVPDSISPFAATAPVSYRGIVGVRHDPPAQPQRDLAPDLVALPPTNFHLATGTAVPGNPYASTRHGVPGDPQSCYAQEADPERPRVDRRCLRFDQGLGNVGDGPLEIRQRYDAGSGDAGHVRTDGRLEQRIYASRGGFRDAALPESAEFHAAHGHFHYRRLVQARLYTWHARQLVREGTKNGFCFLDVRNMWFEHGGGEPRRYSFPGACDPQPDPNALLVAGISPGWADVYAWYLHDQFIDITGLPAGDYVLELEVNAERGLFEANYGNNSASTRIRLSDRGVEELR